MGTPAPGREPASGLIGASLLLLSFATVLFTLAVWKLLSFFIMPSLFFDLLFVGFPAGAFIGVSCFRGGMASFRKTLWILLGVMAASVAASLVCKNFDYLRAHLFEVKLVKLLGQMATFTAFFFPFFCAYGLSEYVGYQVGRSRLRGRMGIVYALYLFGAAAAYLLFELERRQLGITGMLGLSLLLVATAALLLGGSPASRIGSAVVCASLAAVAVFPGLGSVEAGFLDIYKGGGFQSTKSYALPENGGYLPAFQAWGRYSLTEILHSREHGQFAGFYNDLMQWEYMPGPGFRERMIGAAPIHFAPQGGKIAIIGAGGGRQVKWALQPRYRFEKILALELEPAVLDAVRGPLREDFGRVYEAAGVVALAAEARGYMERSRESFDLIFLPSVGGYPQMMLEPGNMIRTADAYRTLRDRLTPRGVLAIWYPSGLDNQGILTQEYVRTLGAQGLGMRTLAYGSQYEYLILAARGAEAKLPTAAEIDEFLTAPSDPSGLPPVSRRDEPEALAQPYFVSDDPGFTPITDDKPFLAGNVRYIFSMEQVYGLFGIVGGFLAVLSAAAFALLRRRGDPAIPGRSYAQVAGLSLLIGANFILFEHFAILALFRKLYIFQDALFVGAIGFLILTGLGSALLGPRTRPWAQGAALVLLVPLLVFQEALSVPILLVLMAPVAFATGSFFPALFDLAARNPLAVFAMDAFGAALGSLVAFFVPIAFGFSAYFPIAGAVFAATCLAAWAFLRKTAPAPFPVSVAANSDEAHPTRP